MQLYWMAKEENVLKLAKDHHRIQMAVFSALSYRQREAVRLFPNMSFITAASKADCGLNHHEKMPL